MPTEGEANKNVVQLATEQEQSEKRDSFLRRPCVNSSLLTGIQSGLVGSIVYFLYSSNPKRVVPSFFAIYSVVSIGAFIRCQYKLNKDRELWDKSQANFYDVRRDVNAQQDMFENTKDYASRLGEK